MEPYHYPVMYREVLNFLEPQRRKVIVDCTLGLGAHAAKMLESMSQDSLLIGIDRDQDSLEVAKKNLKSFNGRFTVARGDFANLDQVLAKVKINRVDAFLFDLGISTYQLNSPQRGFSFLKEGPLDMRMDQDAFVSAYDLVNNLSEGELASIFKKFGEERHARRIAIRLVEARRKEPLTTTTQLTRIIVSALSVKSQHGRIHPATRIFQSLRIAVNRELESLKDGLGRAVELLNKGGRIGVISFHSLEDRIVKHVFKNYASEGILKVITKKPLIPTDLEREENLASRSAKLRIAERN
ncbi:MAG: 16S rRNA (cytosine(1402)-N(4))-methyltransferase RsmH [Candidatus Omnitrophica bacterium]|nr:16S rRNA (cytosine(1402)-N(4))-methyltransferase RsmH [Candidatus Omnitrophota bacterium]